MNNKFWNIFVEKLIDLGWQKGLHFYSRILKYLDFLGYLKVGWEQKVQTFIDEQTEENGIISEKEIKEILEQVKNDYLDKFLDTFEIEIDKIIEKIIKNIIRNLENLLISAELLELKDKRRKTLEEMIEDIQNLIKVRTKQAENEVKKRVLNVTKY